MKKYIFLLLLYSCSFKERPVQSTLLVVRLDSFYAKQRYIGEWKTQYWAIFEDHYHTIYEAEIRDTTALKRNTMIVALIVKQ